MNTLEKYSSITRVIMNLRLKQKLLQQHSLILSFPPRHRVCDVMNTCVANSTRIDSIKKERESGKPQEL